MLKVALTGGIGTGKTYVRERLQSLGVPAIDADAVVHRALAPGTEVTARVAARFGRSLLAPDGSVDRRALAAIVFTDEQARRDLEALVHPVVFETIAEWFTSAAPSGGRAWALADIPLLFETSWEGWFDKVIVAACGPEEQLRRVMARDRVSENDARARLDAQWPIDLKVARADFVVWTDRSFADTDRQVEGVYRVLTALAPCSP